VRGGAPAEAGRGRARRTVLRRRAGLRRLRPPPRPAWRRPRALPGRLRPQRHARRRPLHGHRRRTRQAPAPDRRPGRARHRRARVPGSAHRHPRRRLRHPGHRRTAAPRSLPAVRLLRAGHRTALRPGAPRRRGLPRAVRAAADHPARDGHHRTGDDRRPHRGSALPRPVRLLTATRPRHPGPPRPTPPGRPDRAGRRSRRGGGSVVTKDVIALTPKMPDTWALLAGLYAGGPDATVTAGHGGAVLRLCTPDGRPLVSVEAPLLVQVPGEAERLLGRDVPVPFWWTEVRASGAVPGAERLAGSVCGRLALLLGGSAWPEPAAGTDVVDVRATIAPDDGQPVVDVLTDTTSVVLADRPVLALTTWLSEVLRGTAESGRALQIVTPPHVRVSAPARATLLQVPNRWVVQEPEQGYYDGLSGAVLRWRDGAFTPALGADGTASVAEAFGRTSPSSERQLVVAFRTTLPAHQDIVL